ncbi:SCF E3 ubiquitin ligase complex F-box protein grrA AltName: Full=F-box and leucine-rich repeat protein grrA [Rhizoctonia solani AG-1 IB]|uniref:Rhizoctonia solani AG1-IB WGS project CAOJ00000000 data, isolate 7/3/14, contig 21475 n=1 Tax=Thanatephorus cucumeris (strain AG1-IB / isolate 7/3/14) TaxID=1108050 RepID=M5C9U1_THACB|nr:SCF E3 ubiquitin ligase complex F-box protein grrA AltName: Full=F-box and leucine-rich repeat protein grrA [Rhizoctonia solani AG-1 IB]
MNPSTSASELDVPIGLAIDFADELEFELGLSSMKDKPMTVSSPRLSSVQMSPSPSQVSTAGNMSSLAPNSPASTAYMTSPPTSPTPMSFPPDTRPDSDSDSEREGVIHSPLAPEKGKAPTAPPLYDIKGKSRAIPTPKLPFRDLSLREFQTPPDTTFGTPSGSGMGSTSTRDSSKANSPISPANESTRDLPSIMPLGPSSSSNFSELEIDATPRPSRIRSRALSGLSFSSLRDAVNTRRKTISRQPSITVSGTSSPTPSLARRLSLKGISALIHRKKDRDGSRSRSGLSSEVASGVSTPASEFMTPSSTIARRNGGGNARVSVIGPWEIEPSGSSGEESSSTPQQDDTPPADPIIKAEQEVVSRPVRGRAETAPSGDYFGFTFGFEEEEDNKKKSDVDEPSREDTSDVLVQSPHAANVDPTPRSSFSALPRELHLLVLVHLARSYVDDHARAIQDESWSTTKAGTMENRWVGEAAGLRAVVGMARVSWAWYSLTHDGSFWSKIHYAAILPPRPGIPALTNWLPPAIRTQAKLQLTSADLDEQDERLMRLIQTAGPCLTDLNLRGFTRFNSRHAERVVGWISAPTVEVPRPEQEAGLPARSLLSLTRHDTLPSLPPNTTNLTRLVLSSCFQLTSQALHALLSASPHLTHLEMRGLQAVTDETCSILSSNCRSITHLDISRCTNLGPEALTHICGIARPYIPNTGLLRLKSLNAAGYAYVDSTSLMRLGANLGHTLETLNLAGAWGISDSAIAAYAEIQPTAAQIERAKVAEIERWARAKNQPGMKHMEETHVEFVTLTAREAGFDPTLSGPFYRRRTALRHLNLSNCRRLTDAGLATLAHAVPHLEILEVSGIAGIGQPGLAKLLKTCKDIKRLDLEETLVGDSVLEAITPPMDVDEEDEETLDEESIHIALKADKSHPGHALTHLILSHCASAQLTSGAVAQLIRACPKLTILSVDGTQVDDRVVRFFVCAAQARGLLGAEVGATDTRHVARAGLPPPTSTRPRRGIRNWESRGMAYVDGRDWKEGEDECDERRVVLKTYWSWQGVDATLERRRISSAPGMNRRNTDGGAGGSGIRGGGPRWRGRERDTGGGCVVM